MTFYLQVKYRMTGIKILFYILKKTSYYRVHCDYLHLF